MIELKRRLKYTTPKGIQEKLNIDVDRIKLFKERGNLHIGEPIVGNRETNYTDINYENLRLLVDKVEFETFETEHYWNVITAS